MPDLPDPLPPEQAELFPAPRLLPLWRYTPNPQDACVDLDVLDAAGSA